MELIILGHIIGDFYVQTDNIAEKKKISIKYMLLHCLVYSIILGIVFFIITKMIIETIGIIIIVLLTHFVIDIFKRKFDRKNRYEYMNFIADQAAHIIILFCIFFIVKNNLCIQPCCDYIINELKMGDCIRIGSAFLICWKPASIFISLVFKVIPQTIDKADATIKSESVSKKESVRIGSLIGILEREIMLLLGLMGQFGAIGFVLTAKSLARFKQLENKAFAEKYLVGTLLSSLIAIFCIIVCKI